MMKPGQSATRRKRILWIYTLIMLIPGIILGYLASRGILNDKALREKQLRQELTYSSTNFFNQLDSLLNAVVEHPDIRSVDSENILLAFEQQPDGHQNLLNDHLLYLPKELNADQRQTDLPDNWDRAWELEFVEQNYEGALEFYESYQSDSDPNIQMYALFAKARIQVKEGKPDQAQTSYLTIVENSSRLYYQSFPAKSLALYELIRLSAGNDSNLQKYQEQLYDELKNPELPYGEAQFRFLVEGLSGSDSLRTHIQDQAFKTKQAIQIFHESELLAQASGSNTIIRYFDYGDLSLGFIANHNPDGIRDIVILDLKAFLNKQLESILSISEIDSYHWMIQDEAGNLLWSSHPDSSEEWLSFSFPDQLPRWRLELAMVHQSWISTMLEPGNGVFLLIFIFIILVMLFGLFFTLNILNQEFKLNKLKTEFISNVSHELKSPLTSIRQMTEMLNDQRIESVEQRNDYYGIMLDQSEHLSHLIDNILDFSRMEENRKQYRFETTDVVAVIDKVVSNFKNQLEEQGFSITYEKKVSQAIARIDKDSIKQVLYNLIDNAAKFSPERKQIEISIEDPGPRTQDPNLTKELRRKSEVMLIVRDSGIGIQKKDLERIFDRFYRSAESNKLAIKGSGIGLTLVKLIVEAHGGRIEVDSEPGIGSTFFVYIPLIEEAYEENSAD